MMFWQEVFFSSASSSLTLMEIFEWKRSFIGKTVKITTESLFPSKPVCIFGSTVNGEGELFLSPFSVGKPLEIKFVYWVTEDTW